MKRALLLSLCLLLAGAGAAFAADRDVKEILAGRLEIFFDPTDYLTSVKLNGKTLIKGEGDPLGFEAAERVGDLDFVVVSESHGNSGASYRVIVLDASGKSRILTDDAMFSPGEIKVLKTSDGIELDFGYERKRRKVYAVVSDGASVQGAVLRVKQVATAVSGMKVSDCLWTYQDALEACIDAKESRDPGCRDPEGTWAQVTARGIYAMEAVPGFDRARFAQACISACKLGRRPDIDDFSQTVCSIKGR